MDALKFMGVISKNEVVEVSCKCGLEPIAARSIVMEGHMRVREEVNKQINDAILKNHKHNFIKANDGTYDKVCVICGIRAKQAVMKFKN